MTKKTRIKEKRNWEMEKKGHKSGELEYGQTNEVREKDKILVL